MVRCIPTHSFAQGSARLVRCSQHDCGRAKLVIEAHRKSGRWNRCNPFRKIHKRLITSFFALLHIVVYVIGGNTWSTARIRFKAKHSSHFFLGNRTSEPWELVSLYSEDHLQQRDFKLVYHGKSSYSVIEATKTAK